MAGTLLGRVGEFDSTLESWVLHVERLGHFLDANSITDGDKNCSVLLDQHPTSCCQVSSRQRSWETRLLMN